MRDLGRIIRNPKAFDSDDLTEMRTALSEITRFANEEAFRHANVRTGVEVIASTQELIAAIRQFDKASGEMVQRTNVLTERMYYLTFVVLLVGCVGAIASAWPYFTWWLTHDYRFK